MTAPDDDPLDPAAEEQYLGGCEADEDLDDEDDAIDFDEIPQL